MIVWAIFLAHQSAVVVAGFESEGALKALRCAGVRARRVEGRSTEGRFSLELRFLPYKEARLGWPMATLHFPEPRDWSGFRKFEVDTLNQSEEPAELGVSVAGWVNYFTLPPGRWVTISLPLKFVPDPGRLRRVKSVSLLMRLSFLVRRPERETVFLVDHLRLVPKSWSDEEAAEILITKPLFRHSLYSTHPVSEVEGLVLLDPPGGKFEGLRVNLSLLGPRRAGRIVVTHHGLVYELEVETGGRWVEVRRSRREVSGRYHHSLEVSVDTFVLSPPLEIRKVRLKIRPKTRAISIFEVEAHPPSHRGEEG